MQTDLDDIELLIENITWLSKKMPEAVSNWKATRPVCEYNTGLVRIICENPGKLNDEVFTPMLVWLDEYKLRRTGKNLISKNNVDYFLKSGLRRIFRFVTVAEFFSDNSQYFISNNSNNPANDIFSRNEMTKKYREIISNIDKRLIGCIETLSFNFLKLAETISDLPEDLLEMKSYLYNVCVKKRVQDLKNKV